MVTFKKNPYDWVDAKTKRGKRADNDTKSSNTSSAKESEINTAVIKLDMTYKNKALPDSSMKNGLGVTVSTGLPLDPKSFTNATLSDKNSHTAVISVDRVSPTSILQLYMYAGKVTPQDFDHFKDLSKMSVISPFIYSGYVNVTLYHGNGSDALKALEGDQFNLFTPVWLYNFRYVNDINFLTLSPK